MIDQSDDIIDKSADFIEDQDSKATLKSACSSLWGIFSCMSSEIKAEEILKLARVHLQLENYEDLATLLHFLSRIQQDVQAILRNLIYIVNLRKTSSSSSSRKGTDVLLSLNDLRAIYTALEVLWTLGLQFLVERETKYAPSQDTYPKTILIAHSSLRQLRDIMGHSSANNSVLWDYVLIFRDIIFTSEFPGMMVDRNFKRFYLSLLAFSSVESSVASEAGQLLDSVNSNRDFTYLIISELKAVIPTLHADYQKRLGSIFSGILVSEGGLGSVLQGYLRDVDDPAALERVHVAVAQLVTRVPRGLTLDAYLRRLCPQLLEVLTLAVRCADHKCVRQVVMVLCRLCGASKCTALVTYLVFDSMIPPIPAVGDHNEVTSEILVGEHDVELTVRVLHAVATTCPLSPGLASCLAGSGAGALLLALLVHDARAPANNLHGLLSLTVSKLLVALRDQASAFLVSAVKLSPPVYECCVGAAGGVAIGRGSSVGGCSPEACAGLLVSALLGVRANLESTQQDEGAQAGELELVISQLFIHVLRNYLGLSTADDSSLVSALLLVRMLEAVPIEYLFKNGRQVLSLLQAFLEAHTLQKEKTAGALNSADIVDTILSILSSVLSLGNAKRTTVEEVILVRIAESLAVIGRSDPNLEVREAAADIGLLILCRVSSVDSAAAESSPAPIDSVEHLLERSSQFLLSKDPATRGYGVRSLVLYIRDPAVFLGDEEKLRLLDVFTALLADADSFVYLSAIHAVALLGRRDRVVLLPRIVQLVAEDSLRTRTRVLLSEALCIIIRKTAPLAPQFANVIIRACIQMVRRRPGSQEEEAIAAASIDLNTMKSSLKTSSQEEPVGFTVSDSILLRQSSISMLSDTVLSSEWDAFRYLTDVLDIAMGIFTFENSRAQIFVNARRSASFLLAHVLKNLKEKLFHSSFGAEYLSTMYRTLKQAKNDSDKVVRHHIEGALQDLDSYIKSQLFVAS